MANSDRFRQQHDELLALANDLAAELDPGKLAQDAAAARSLLSKLAGKLLLHLGAEDQHLYPRLIESDNPETRRIARQFVEEMGDIAKVFTAYNERWRTTGSIQNHADDFIYETKAIYGALATRIDKENSILYPLMD